MKRHSKIYLTLPLAHSHPPSQQDGQPWALHAASDTVSIQFLRAPSSSRSGSAAANSGLRAEGLAGTRLGPSTGVVFALLDDGSLHVFLRTVPVLAAATQAAGAERTGGGAAAAAAAPAAAAPEIGRAHV